MLAVSEMEYVTEMKIVDWEMKIVDWVLLNLFMNNTVICYHTFLVCFRILFLSLWFLLESLFTSLQERIFGRLHVQKEHISAWYKEMVGK